MQARLGRRMKRPLSPQKRRVKMLAVPVLVSAIGIIGLDATGRFESVVSIPQNAERGGAESPKRKKARTPPNGGPKLAETLYIAGRASGTQNKSTALKAVITTYEALRNNGAINNQAVSLACRVFRGKAETTAQFLKYFYNHHQT